MYDDQAGVDQRVLLPRSREGRGMYEEIVPSESALRNARASDSPSLLALALLYFWQMLEALGRSAALHTLTLSP